MTPEQERLCALIDGHAAAMKAQVVDPHVRIQLLLDNGLWGDVEKGAEQALCNERMPYQKLWRRLAPAPKLVPLDQSDFLGPNRVTHIRDKGGAVYAISYVSNVMVGFGCGTSTTYRTLQADWECSRDNGETWGPCSKEAKV